MLDRFKERKVGLSVESQYDPTKVKKAEVAIKELLAEHGRQFATIRSEVRPIPPAAVGITFVVKEGPKVKVGQIKFEGNKNVNSRILRAAMKNLKPIGIPHSIFLENIFAKTYDATKLEEDTERVRGEYQNRGYFKVLVQDPKTEIHDTGHARRSHSSAAGRPGQGGGHHHADRRRRQVQAGGYHLQEQQGDAELEGLAHAVPDQGWRHIQPREDRQGPGKPAQGLRRRTATSTSPRFRIRGSTTRRS